MRRLVAHRGGQPERQSGQLKREQTDDAREERDGKQQERALQEEDDAGDDQREECERVGEVVAKLLRLDQEQLRDTLQPSPELSHVEHCSRGPGEFGPKLDAPSKCASRVLRRVPAILTPFFLAPT